MSGIRCGIFLNTTAALVFLAMAVPGRARAQAVAFQPTVGVLPNGPVLGTTPTVSVDRRYVRIGVNAQFIGNVAFTTLQVPAAVGGGPGGPGALGGVGLGGIGGMGGGGRGPGGGVLAGMNGVIDPTMTTGFNTSTGYGYAYGNGYGYGYGPNPGGFPSDQGLMNDPGLAAVAPPAFGGRLPKPLTSREMPPRTSAAKALKRAGRSKGTTKHPATTAGNPR